MVFATVFFGLTVPTVSENRPPQNLTQEFTQQLTAIPYNLFLSLHVSIRAILHNPTGVAVQLSSELYYTNRFIERITSMIGIFLCVIPSITCTAFLGEFVPLHAPCSPFIPAQFVNPRQN